MSAVALTELLDESKALAKQKKLPEAALKLEKLITADFGRSPTLSQFLILL